MVQSPSWEANWFAASQEFPRIFMEPEGSLPHSQASATCPYPGPAQSSPHTHIPPPGDRTHTTKNHNFTLTLPPPSLQNETTNVVINIIVASS